jgi:hypothetical protein
MDIMSIFEIIMLISFGSAWPFSIYTSYKARTARGKNPVFLIILLIGYIAGIIHKLLNSFDLVIAFYILNFILVSIDTALYFRNKKLDLKRQGLTSYSSLDNPA